MTTATRGLVRYEGPVDTHQSSPYGDAWQDQVDMAASCLAAAALAGGMPRVAGTMGERQLARYLASQAARRRRTSTAKITVILVGWAIALAAGCYIGGLV
jgi:hypothetical protein